MKKFLLFLLLMLIPIVLMAQSAGGFVKRSTPKRETTLTTTKFRQSRKKQSTTSSKKAEKPKQESKEQELKGQETLGYDVIIMCNVPSAALSIDGMTNGTANGTRFLKSGLHNIQLLADGYEPLSRTITVGSSSTTFSFSMKQIAHTLSPVLQNLVNNMVRVEGGKFSMGAMAEQGINNGIDYLFNAKPVHQVYLNSFFIGKYEITQEEWQMVMGNNPSRFQGAKQPVEQVSWEDCQEFVRKLNILTGKQFRLPTEAEWEYAARGGNRSTGYIYAGSNNPSLIAWYYFQNDPDKSTHHNVGQKSPNELGLYDMSGNVWEWCQDWYGNYDKNSQNNPVGPSNGTERVLRGGSWFNEEICAYTSFRSKELPSHSSYSVGLRLAL